MRAFISCDGEQKQIEVFQEDDVLAAFKDTLIDFGKIPASCSAICQSSDVSPFFKATKKKLKSAVQLGKDTYGSRVLQDNLQNAVADIASITLQKKAAIVDALLQVIWAIRETITMDIVKAGYR